MAFLLIGNIGAEARAQSSFVTFESGHVRPLALSPDGSRLFATNTPDNRLEIFRNASDGLPHLASVPVGMEPVAVAARTDTEVWVVNHLSDSVSVIDLRSHPPRVTRTLLVGDEPRDIVFAGHDRSRAFITTAHRGQHRTHPSIASVPGAGDPQLTTPSVPRADIWVFDALNLGDTLGGTPLKIIELFGDTPRALAVSPGGGTVYAAVFHSGNQTAAVAETAVCNTSDENLANNRVEGPCEIANVIMPGGLPLPHRNANGDRRPETGLIVKFDGATGIWRDELGRDWTNAIRFDLPDKDVFAIDVGTLEEQQSFPHVGTILFNMAVNPVNGKVYVSNSEARNEVRFAGPGVFVEQPGAKPAGQPSTAQGRLHEMRITVLDGQTVLPRHLNKHIDYTLRPAPVETKDHSLSIPLDMAISSDGTTLYVTAFGSGTVGVFATSDLERDTFDPTIVSADYLSVSGGGPSGVVLDEPNGRVYVLTRFDNSISVIDLTSRQEISHIGMFNPEPPHIVAGRRFLYDAKIASSNGEASCASCHIFGDLDSLAWDLGNPDDAVLNNPIAPKLTLFAEQFENINGTGKLDDFHPMKGPMTTQTLRGMVHHGSMRWRGDRTGGNDPDSRPSDSFRAFMKFIVDFEGLLGNDASTPFADERMEAFTNFILDVALPPNPVRPLNNSLLPEQQAGKDFFLSPLQPGFPCIECHVINPLFGSFGTDGTVSFKNEPQIFKIPHLRNLYQKVGMFGMPEIPFLLPTDRAHQGDQVRGFGFLHDGSIDTLFRHTQARVFDDDPRARFGTDQERRDVEAFLLAFDTDLAPIVGQQVTLTEGNADAVGSRIDLMIERARTPFDVFGGAPRTECDLVVKGTIGHRPRGWVMKPRSGLFRSDRKDEPLLTDAELKTLANRAGQELTYTCVPPGSGRRIGIDRDEDGVFDHDDRPDLTGTIIQLKRKVKATGEKLKVKFNVTNLGTDAAQGPFPVSLYLSDNNHFNDADDRLLETFMIGTLEPSVLRELKFTREEPGSFKDKFIFVIISDDAVDEHNTENNQLEQQIS